MMRLSSAKIFGVLLGLGVLADAHAATFSIEPNVVPAGGSIVFHVTTEKGAWPSGYAGAEGFVEIVVNGPCTVRTSIATSGFGASYNVPFPGPSWEFDRPGEHRFCTSLSKLGQYVAMLTYIRYDGSVVGTSYQIEVPFSVVLEKLEVDAIPGSIPAGDSTAIEVSGVNSVDPTTALQVACPDGTVDHAVDVTPIDAGFSMIWPGPYFAGGCDSSQPGGYQVTLATGSRSATTSFRVFGDRDGDGVLDGYDNCPIEPNSDQHDADDDGRGDACDTDRDNDAVVDEGDNCPDDRNTSQDDLDVDGLGDVCDPDIEDDGVLNAADNCPNHYNPAQENADGDAFGDSCDPDPEDSDNDGTSNLVDNCPSIFNPAQQDDDGDGVGTACDPDIDGDGISNANEAVAGTNPNDPQPLEAGINPFWEGGAIGSGASVPDGEPVGVVVNPATGVGSIGVTVVDPWGNPYSQQTLIPQSPVAFYFVPIWTGTWTVEADMNNGEVLSALIAVIPEPAAALGGLAAVATLLALRRR